MDAPRVSVVMPAHNEQGALPRVVADVETALGQWPHEIVIVDDGSHDRTWEVIRSLKRDRPTLKGIRLSRNFGHQAALVAGLRACSGAAVIMMDADGQHPAEMLPEFLRLWEAGTPIVQGVRTSSDGEGPLKRLTSQYFYKLWSALSGVQIVKGAADFRLMDRAPLDVLLTAPGSLMFLRGLVPWLGYRITHVPFEARTRIAGATGYTWLRMIRLSIDALTAFSVVPLRLAMALGITMSLVSFLYLCYIFVVFFLGHVVSGWASTAGLVALVGGIQLFTIGVLGEYVGRIFLHTTDRPQFVIAERL